MGVLTVRNVDEALIRKLKLRAAQHGRSAEAEHRLILEQALGPDRQALVRELREHRRSLEGRDFSDMTEIIRRSRDSGLGGVNGLLVVDASVATKWVVPEDDSELPMRPSASSRAAG